MSKLPRLINFSGGKTSAYMTWLELQKGLSDTDFIVFCDTGKERTETHQFITDCETYWGIKVHRLTREGGFEALINQYGLPNQLVRFCTGKLKIRTSKKFMKDLGFKFWYSYLGIRADEKQRIRVSDEKSWENIYPLNDLGITVADVETFWETQPFTLNLKRYQGNCDLCFLKSNPKLIQIMRESPELAEWWIEQEKKTGSRFKQNISYSMLLELSQRPTLFDELPPDLTDADCHCTID